MTNHLLKLSSTISKVSHLACLLTESMMRLYQSVVRQGFIYNTLTQLRKVMCHCASKRKRHFLSSAFCQGTTYGESLANLPCNCLLSSTPSQFQRQPWHSWEVSLPNWEAGLCSWPSGLDPGLPAHDILQRALRFKITLNYFYITFRMLDAVHSHSSNPSMSHLVLMNSQEVTDLPSWEKE